jgi:hypothetical protein
MKHFGSKIKPGIFRCQAFLHHKHQSPNLPVIPVIEVSPRTANLSRKGGNYYSVKADFSVWPDLRNTLLPGYVGL